MPKETVLIIGGGAFGASSAIELRKRGYTVSIVDLEISKGASSTASSTDISKVVRSDYGKDPLYTNLHTECIKRWHEWNKKWGEELYHETGLVVLLKQPLREGTYPGDSFKTLLKRGYPVRKMGNIQLREKFPKFSSLYKYGYHNKKAGWVESGKVVNKLLQEAKELGVTLIDGEMTSLITEQVDKNKKAVGVKLSDGSELRADWIIVAAGAWTPVLLPQLRDRITVVAQPIFHFKPENEEQLKEYNPPSFPVYFADPLNFGFYGFPAHPTEKVLKIAAHSKGYPLDYNQPITKEKLDEIQEKIYPLEEARFRNFLKRSIPDLKDAKIVKAKVCLYCDTFDGDFLIDKDPNTLQLIVATGGSGHGFKFTPCIGEIVADVLENKPNPYKSRFAWRRKAKIQYDAARHVPKSIPKAKL